MPRGRDLNTTLRFESALDRPRILARRRGRADRPSLKGTPTVRTFSIDAGGGALGAKRTLKRANPRIG